MSLIGRLVHPLLTRDERRTLDDDERQALRTERQRDRDANRDPARVPWIRWHAVEHEAAELILDIARANLRGDVKLDDVVASVVAALDQRLVWDELVPLPWSAILEAADGPAIRWILGGLIRSTVQRTYDGIKLSGRIS